LFELTQHHTAHQNDTQKKKKLSATEGTRIFKKKAKKLRGNFQKEQGKKT